MCDALGNAWDDTKSAVEGPWKMFTKGDPVGQAISGNSVSWNPDHNIDYALDEQYNGDPGARHLGIGRDDYKRGGKVAAALLAAYFGGGALAGMGGEGGAAAGEGGIAADSAAGGSAGLGGDAGAFSAGGGTAAGGDAAVDSYLGDAAAGSVSGSGASSGGFGEAGSVGGGDAGAAFDAGGAGGGATSSGGVATNYNPTWWDTAVKYGKPLATSKGVGALLNMYSHNQASKQLQDQTNTLNNMYTPGSPEYEQMRKQMEARDAAAGRRSQYGPRSVELAANIAKIKSGNMLSSGYGQMLDGQMKNKYAKYADLASLYDIYSKGE